MKITKNIQNIAERALIIEADAVRNLSKSINNHFTSSVTLIHQLKGRLIVTGVGKSAIVGQKIAATMNSTGTPSLFMHAADAIHGDLGMVQPSDAVLCISKSGNTPEIAALVPLIKMRGNPLIGMVAQLDSALGRASDWTLHTPVAIEACPNNLAPTTSTTLQMAMGDALAICLLEVNGFTSKDFAKHHPGGALGKQLYTTVDDLMEKNASPLLEEDATIKEIIVAMSEGRLGCVGVTKKNQIIGIITDGDLRRMLEKENITNIFARNIMTPKPITVDSGTLAVDALALFKTAGVNQLIIKNSSNEALGFIHVQDLIKEGIL